MAAEQQVVAPTLLQAGSHRQRRWRYGWVVIGSAAVGACGSGWSLGSTTWIGGSGSWSDAGNWSKGVVPGYAEFVVVSHADAVDRTIWYDYTGGAVVLNSLSIDNGGGGTTTFVMATPGSALTSFYEDISESATGTPARAVFVHSAGTNTIQYNSLNIGTHAGHTGTYSLSGTGVLATTLGASQVIGFVGGVGSFVQTGGTNTASATLSIGYGGGTGSYSLSGTGKLTAGTQSIGPGGRGTFTQSGGTNSVGTLYVGGQNTASTGTYTLSAGSVSVSGGAYVGGSVIAAPANCLGVLKVSGGQMSVQGTLRVWDSGASRIDVSSGTLTAGATDNRGAINVTGGSVLLGPVTGTGTLNVGGAGAPAVTAASLQQGTVNVTGGGSLKVTGGAMNTVRSLKVSGGGRVDLTSTKLIVDHTGQNNPVATIRGYLLSGYSGGGWDGPGIASSYVAGLNASQPSLVRSLAYADGADGVMSGLPPGQIAILVAVAGDATLNGNVNYADFQIVQQNFGLAGGWTKGDFNYSGVVDFDDFRLLAWDFSNTAGLTTVQFDTMNALARQFGQKLVANATPVGFQLVAIPEPAGGSAALAALSLMRRRGRRARGR